MLLPHFAYSDKSVVRQNDRRPWACWLVFWGQGVLLRCVRAIQDAGKEGWSLLSMFSPP